MSKIKQLVSIICPVYNEEKTIPIFTERIEKVVAKIKGRYDFELLFTNNCSEDNTLKVLKDYSAKNKWANVLTLSKNFGYQASLLAGLHHCKGDMIFIIDVDCEDPPELLLDFLDKYEEGNDIVYGIRNKRAESLFLQLSRKLYYRFLKIIGDHEVILDMAEFSLFSKHVKDLVISNQNTYPFIRTELAYLGFKKHGVPYNREPRVAGDSNYSFLQMFPFAIAGILTASTYLLRLPFYMLPFIVFVNILSVLKFHSYKYIALFLLSFNSICIVFICAVACLYIARIYSNNIKRPLFVVNWKHSTLKFPK